MSITMDDVVTCLNARVRRELELEETLVKDGRSYWFRKQGKRTRVIRIYRDGERLILKRAASYNHIAKDPKYDAAFSGGTVELLAIVREEIALVKQHVFGEV